MVKATRKSTGQPATFGPDFLGRELRALHEPNDYDDKIKTIKKWLEVCTDHHPGCRPEQDEVFERDLRKTTFFGVIDVEEMCLKPLPQGAEYVALSYQWGTTEPRFTTKRDTVLEIMERNGLAQYLPERGTIRETFDLVSALGFKYLWIDSLCKSIYLATQALDYVYID